MTAALPVNMAKHISQVGVVAKGKFQEWQDVTVSEQNDQLDICIAMALKRWYTCLKCGRLAAKNLLKVFLQKAFWYRRHKCDP